MLPDTRDVFLAGALRRMPPARLRELSDEEFAIVTAELMKQRH